MKEIKAYVHRSRVADVIAALKATSAWQAAVKAGRHNLAVCMVKGSLRPLDEDERHYSLELGDEMVHEYKLELLCEDSEVDELVQAVCRAAHTGLTHSGLVTVTSLAQAVVIP
jgi:nitrogen regulatory protein P-II 1